MDPHFPICHEFFGIPKVVNHASQIPIENMTVHSPRLSAVPTHMLGSKAASFKWGQRFLQRQEGGEVLRLVFNEKVLDVSL